MLEASRSFSIPCSSKKVSISFFPTTGEGGENGDEAWRGEFLSEERECLKVGEEVEEGEGEVEGVERYWGSEEELEKEEGLDFQELSGCPPSESCLSERGEEVRIEEFEREEFDTENEVGEGTAEEAEEGEEDREAPNSSE